MVALQPGVAAREEAPADTSLMADEQAMEPAGAAVAVALAVDVPPDAGIV